MGPQVIYGLRHARTALDVDHRSDGQIDLPLSDEGRRELVAVLVSKLQGVPIQSIHASPLRRTQETAHIVKSGLPSDPMVVTDPALETWKMGQIAGREKQSNKPVVKYLMKHPSVTPLGGESYRDFTGRFDKAMKQQMSDVESGKIQGPVLDVLSGSNCRRLSEKLFGDREILNVDEAGLFMLYPAGNGKWTGMVIEGKSDSNDEAS